MSLDTALEMGKKMGFDTENYEYYCGSVSIGDKNKKDIAIWSHLDVVPEGDESDWRFRLIPENLKTAIYSAADAATIKLLQ